MCTPDPWAIYGWSDLGNKFDLDLGITKITPEKNSWCQNCIKKCYHTCFTPYYYDPPPNPVATLDFKELQDLLQGCCPAGLHENPKLQKKTLYFINWQTDYHAFNKHPSKPLLHHCQLILPSWKHKVPSSTKCHLQAQTKKFSLDSIILN